MSKRKWKEPTAIGRITIRILRHQNIFVMCIAILCIFSLHAFYNITEYVFDAERYWESAYTFGVEQFRLTNYSDSLRGYLLPLLHFVLIKIARFGIGTEKINLWLFHSILYAFFIMIVFPGLTEKMFRAKKFTVIEKLLFLILFCIFFRGLIVYPLSDVLGFGFFTAGLYSLILMRDETNRKIKYVWGGVAGIMVMAAYYVRPVYLIAVIGYIFYFLYETFRKKELTILFCFLGMIVVMLPQIQINMHNYQMCSPLVQTQKDFENKSLYLMQLEWGMSVTKYETNLDFDYYENPAFRYEDYIGKKILEDQSFENYGDYIIFAFTHFFDVACIYLKHIFNGLDIVYPDVYIYHLTGNRFWIQFVNYSLIFLGGIGFSSILKARNWKKKDIVMWIIYMLPILLVIPTAVETRFFMGVHLLFYLCACFLLCRKESLLHFVKHKKYLIGYLCFVSVCFMLNSEIMGRYAIPIW